MGELDGLWLVRRTGGALPPMVGVRKQITGGRGRDDARAAQVPVRRRGPLAALPLSAGPGGRAGARGRRFPRPRLPRRSRGRALSARADRCYKGTVSMRAVFVVAVTVFLVAAAQPGRPSRPNSSRGSWSISSDGADAIAVTCSGGAAGERRRPGGRPAPCGEVESVEISGGPDANTIDLSGVTATAFPNVEFVAFWRTTAPTPSPAPRSPTRSTAKTMTTRSAATQGTTF